MRVFSVYSNHSGRKNEIKMARTCDTFFNVYNRLRISMNFIVNFIEHTFNNSLDIFNRLIKQPLIDKFFYFNNSFKKNIKIRIYN